SALLVGHSMGVQLALEAYRSQPQRVNGLALICGSAGRPLDTFHDNGLLKRAFPFLKALVHRYPKAATWLAETVIPTELAFQFAKNLELNPRLIRREDFFPYLKDLSRIDPELFLRM